MGVALPELPDDRRASPRRYEPAERPDSSRHGVNTPPSGQRPSVPPPGRQQIPPGGPLPSTPWPVDGHGVIGANGRPKPVVGHPRDLTSASGRQAAVPPPPRGGSHPNGVANGRPPVGRPVPNGQAPNGRPRGQAPSGPSSAIGPARRPGPVDDEPTVVHGRLVGLPEPDEAPGRHRRRAGESPDGRPASSYQAEAAAVSGRKAKPGRRRRPAFWKELPLLIVVALLLTFLIQTFLAKVYVIPSGSMETTLHGCTGCNNDRVLVDKVTYRFSDPRPGDVVVFRGPDSWNSEFTADPPGNIVVQGLQQLGSLIGLAPPDEKDFVKRVIAVGGQTVQCCDSRNRVLVDGKPLDEPYIYYLPEAGRARQDTFGPVTVPQGELWMMGDSRNNSADSRVPGHGPVPVANVIGKARLIVLPFSRFGGIPDPNPQTSTALGMTGGSDSTVPLGVAVIGAFPLLLGRRRLDRLDAELDGFLPGRRTRRR